MATCPSLLEARQTSGTAELHAAGLQTRERNAATAACPHRVDGLLRLERVGQERPAQLPVVDSVGQDQAVVRTAHLHL